MRKVKTGFYFYLIANILTKVLQKFSCSTPLQNISFLLKPHNSMLAMATKMLNLQKILKNHLLISNKGNKAETFQNFS